MGKAAMRTFLLLLVGWAAPMAAAAPALQLPIACRAGEDCWAVLFMDVDPSAEARDFMCGRRTYDAHHGTDIAIADLAAMRRGVPVLAAAAGVVKAVRDGMPDIAVEATDRARVAGRECGNGVLIDHGDGFETQYCHLRSSSVRVRPGDRVAAGTPLGLVGLSGQTNFPHLEFIVRHHGRPVDPFRGLAGGPQCGPGIAPLWTAEARQALSYAPVILTKMGVASDRPDWALVQEGGFADRELPASTPALVVWVEGYGLEAGDLVRFAVWDATTDTPVFTVDSRAEAAKARFFRFAGRRAPAEGFQPGRYRARVELLRGGQVVAFRELPFLLR